MYLVKENSSSSKKRKGTENKYSLKDQHSEFLQTAIAVLKLYLFLPLSLFHCLFFSQEQTRDWKGKRDEDDDERKQHNPKKTKKKAACMAKEKQAWLAGSLALLLPLLPSPWEVLEKHSRIRLKQKEASPEQNKKQEYTALTPPHNSGWHKSLPRCCCCCYFSFPLALPHIIICSQPRRSCTTSSSIKELVEKQRRVRIWPRRRDSAGLVLWEARSGRGGGQLRRRRPCSEFWFWCPWSRRGRLRRWSPPPRSEGGGRCGEAARRESRGGLWRISGLMILLYRTARGGCLMALILYTTGASLHFTFFLCVLHCKIDSAWARFFLYFPPLFCLCSFSSDASFWAMWPVNSLHMIWQIRNVSIFMSMRI